MKITYPHLGNAYIAIEALLRALGHEPITPPLGTARTLERGSELSPEQICLPFKIILGNMLEGLSLGAEAVWMIGGWGPCRLGYYGEIQRILLEQEYKELKFLLLEVPKYKLTDAQKLLRAVFSKTQFRSLSFGSKLAWSKLIAIERLEQAALKGRPHELKRGTTTKIVEHYLQEIRQANSVETSRALVQEGELELLSRSKTGKTTPIKIAIVGEIYTVMEPFANLGLEQRLGDLGVEVIRTISFSNWVEDHIFKKLLGRSHIVQLKRWAHGYLHSFVGGHGLESVAHSIELSQQDIQGVIQILPMGCMPEIIAQGILPKVSSDYNLPILSLVVDEHVGETGFQTRLEAFVDLLERQVSTLA